MSATPLTPAQAAKLERALTASGAPPEAAILLTLLKSGMRIGDVLDLSKRQVAQAMKSRPAYETYAWAALKHNWKRGRNCAESVCPVGLGESQAGHCAYQRCRRYLVDLGEQLKLGHLNLQRLRATTVARLLREGFAPEEIQKRLGYKSLRGVQYHQSRAEKHK